MASSKKTIVEALAQVKNVGPSYAQKMYDELEIRSVEDLAEAARNGRLKEIKGIGPAKQAAILEAAEAELREPRKAEPVDVTKAAAELSEKAKVVGEKQRKEAKKTKKAAEKPARAPEQSEQKQAKKSAGPKPSAARPNGAERKEPPRAERPAASERKRSTSIPGLIFKIARKLVGRILK